MQNQRILFAILLCLCLSVVSSSLAYSASTTSTPEGNEGTDFRVVVYDATEKIPIGLARVVLQRGKKFIAQNPTNMVGQVLFRNIQPGSYRLTAWFVGYEIFTDSVLIDQDHTNFTINLRPQESQVQAVEVVGQRELGVSNIDMMTGNQTFESETYHPPPTNQMTNLIQQNLTGA